MKSIIIDLQNDIIDIKNEIINMNKILEKKNYNNGRLIYFDPDDLLNNFSGGFIIGEFLTENFPLTFSDSSIFSINISFTLFE